MLNMKIEMHKAALIISNCNFIFVDIYFFENASVLRAHRKRQ